MIPGVQRKFNIPSHTEVVPPSDTCMEIVKTKCGKITKCNQSQICGHFEKLRNWLEKHDANGALPDGNQISETAGIEAQESRVNYKE